jgi:hypothetical protein
VLDQESLACRLLGGRREEARHRLGGRRHRGQRGIEQRIGVRRIVRRQGHAGGEIRQQRHLAEAQPRPQLVQHAFDLHRQCQVHVRLIALQHEGEAAGLQPRHHLASPRCANQPLAQQPQPRVGAGQTEARGEVLEVA